MTQKERVTSMVVNIAPLYSLTLRLTKTMFIRKLSIFSKTVDLVRVVKAT